LLLPFRAVAGGFLLFEQGVKGLGNAFAGGAAIAEDSKIRKSGTETEVIPRGALNDDDDASVNIFSAQVNVLF